MTRCPLLSDAAGPLPPCAAGYLNLGITASAGLPTPIGGVLGPSYKQVPLRMLISVHALMSAGC